MVTIVPPSLRAPTAPAPAPDEPPSSAPAPQAPPPPAVQPRTTPASDLATTVAASDQAASAKPGPVPASQSQGSQPQGSPPPTGTPSQTGQPQTGQPPPGQSAAGQPPAGTAAPSSTPGAGAASTSLTATPLATPIAPAAAPTTSPTTPPLISATLPPTPAVPAAPALPAASAAPAPSAAPASAPVADPGQPIGGLAPPLPGTGSSAPGPALPGAAPAPTPTPAAMAAQAAAAPNAAIAAAVAATAAPIARPTAPAASAVPPRDAAAASIAARPSAAAMMAAAAALAAGSLGSSSPFAATPRLAPGALYDIPRFVGTLGEEPIAALVLGQSPEGVTVLSLPQGTLAFQSASVLRPGQELLISVRDAATNPSVVLETAPEAVAPEGPAPLVAGQALDATVVRGTPPNTAGPLAETLRGDQLTLHVVSQQMPGAPLVTAAASEPAAAPGAPLPLPAPGPATVTARVIAANPAGQAIALVGGAVVAINGPSLPVGLELNVAVTAIQRAPAAGSLQPALGTLPALTRLVEQLPNLTPAAQTAILAALPKPGPRLAAEVINLIAAARYGTLTALIGEGAKRELDKTGRRRLGGEVATELASLGRGRERIAGDWRGYTLPIVNGYVVEPIRLYVHRDETGEDDPAAAGNGGTRFLLDLALTNLGSIQIDGLAKPPRFDVVIRSPDRLPETVVSEMRDIFLQATSARGLAGSLLYQVAPPLRLVTDKVDKGGILV